MNGYFKLKHFFWIDVRGHTKFSKNKYIQIATIKEFNQTYGVENVPTKISTINLFFSWE